MSELLILNHSYPSKKRATINIYRIRVRTCVFGLLQIPQDQFEAVRCLLQWHQAANSPVGKYQRIIREYVQCICHINNTVPCLYLYNYL